MTAQTAWHSRDEFWELVEPLIFNQARISDAAAEVEKIVELLQIGSQDRVLDLCCGIGRHSLEISRRGFSVMGVDRTIAYIDRASRAAAEGALDVEFVVGDMREYCAPDGFDIVLNLFGSFGYFEEPGEDRRVVENVYKTLRPGGRFLIETMGKEILARDFQQKDWDEEDDLLMLMERKITRDWACVETRWIAIQGDRRIEHRTTVHSYSAVELSSLLKSCGFSKVRVYGDIEGAAYDQAAKRLVVAGYK